MGVNGMVAKCSTIWIPEFNEKKKPFLIYFGFSHPHDERWGRDDLNQKYGVRNVKEPPLR